MRASGGVVHEEGLLGALGPHAMKPGDGLVGHVVGQVVVLTLGHADDALVLGDERVVLPALPAEEAPEVVESPGTGPTVERPRRSLFVIGGEVPFADGCSGVAVALEDLRKRRRVLGGEAAVAGEAGRRLGHGTEGHGVMVAPGQEGRPRGRAQCGHVEVVVAEPTVREAGERGRVDGAAEGAGVAEAGVVDEHQQNVRRALRRFHRGNDVPVGHRPFERPMDRPGERRVGNWQDGTVDVIAHRDLLHGGRRDDSKAVVASARVAGSGPGPSRLVTAPSRQDARSTSGGRSSGARRDCVPKILRIRRFGR